MHQYLGSCLNSKRHIHNTYTNHKLSKKNLTLTGEKEKYMTIVYLAHVTELWLVDHTKVDISLYKNKKVMFLRWRLTESLEN